MGTGKGKGKGKDRSPPDRSAGGPVRPPAKDNLATLETVLRGRARKLDREQQQAIVLEALASGELADERLAPALAAALGSTSLGELIAERVVPVLGAQLAPHLRGGFEGGNEQGNARRLEVLVRQEGAGAVDVLTKVLRDKVEVGGIYSNLRNTALELIAAHLPGQPELENPLYDALKLDQYLHWRFLAPVLASYRSTWVLDRLIAGLDAEDDEDRDLAAQSLATSANPGARARLLALLDEAVARLPPPKRSKRASSLLRALGALPPDAELSREILRRAEPLLETYKSAAATALARHTDRRELLIAIADKLDGDKAAWFAPATTATARLGPGEVFERVTRALVAADRRRDVGGDRATTALGAIVPPVDPRWKAWLPARLAEEKDGRMRRLLTLALGALRDPTLIDAILAAPQGKRDSPVVWAIPEALVALGDPSAIPRVEEEMTQVKPGSDHHQALETALRDLRRRFPA